MRPEPTGWKLPPPLIAACLIGMLLGAVGLALAFAASAREGWLWLIVNFVVFWGISAGMLTWAAAFRIAQATWTSSVSRIGHAGIAVVPLLAVMLIVLVAGVRGYAPWIEHPHGKEAWLNVQALGIRQVLTALLFWVPCWMMVRASLKGDTLSQIDATDTFSRRLNAVAVFTAAAFSITATIVSWDFIMSLTPEWMSTVFSVYYFTTSLYAAMAVMIILAAVLRKPLGVEDKLKPAAFRDMGNLLLAFALFSLGLFYAQYLTIWYGNLPEETPFLMLRYAHSPWQGLSWASFLIGYAIPFLLLQSRSIKLRPKLLSAVAAIILVGVALERYILVVPSLEPRKLLTAPAGLLSLFGFLGLFVICITWFLARYRPAAKADEVFTK